MFKKVVATVFALAFVAGVVASSPLKLSEVRAESEAGRVVSGVITLARSGDPIAGIVVGLFRQGQPNPFRQSTTNREGKYRFTEVPAGEYRIRPLSSGYSYRPEVIRAIVGNMNLWGQNFTASPSGVPATPSPTPIALP